jgi:hypothetical protein
MTIKVCSVAGVMVAIPYTVNADERFEGVTEGLIWLSLALVSYLFQIFFYIKDLQSLALDRTDLYYKYG